MLSFEFRLPGKAVCPANPATGGKVCFIKEQTQGANGQTIIISLNLCMGLNPGVFLVLDVSGQCSPVRLYGAGGFDNGEGPVCRNIHLDVP